MFEYLFNLFCDTQLNSGIGSGENQAIISDSSYTAITAKPQRTAVRLTSKYCKLSIYSFSSVLYVHGTDILKALNPKRVRDLDISLPIERGSPARYRTPRTPPTPQPSISLGLPQRKAPTTPKSANTGELPSARFRERRRERERERDYEQRVPKGSRPFDKDNKPTTKLLDDAKVPFIDSSSPKVFRGHERRISKMSEPEIMETLRKLYHFDDLILSDVCD
jgi:hypothetical protein